MLCCLKNEHNFVVLNQGRNSGQRAVLQEIPYPAETQEGSNILNASILDTHHMPSVELLTHSKHEESIVNEELVLSLTSTNDENARKYECIWKISTVSY